MTDRLLLALQQKGIFGVPHGILSSPDEWVALAIGLVAVAAAVLYDGDLDLRPMGTAAVAGILISLVAPSVVTDEWHVPVVVVILALGGTFVLYRT